MSLSIHRISYAASQVVCYVVNFMKNGWMFWRTMKLRKGRCRTSRGRILKTRFQTFDEISKHVLCAIFLRLMHRLPKENALLLRYLLAVLHTIKANAHENQMNAFNLSVCIAPSMLWPPGAPCSPEVEGKETKKVSE